MTPRVSVVIVTYQSERTIGPALAGLRPTVDAGLAEIIVVDNASTDGTREVVCRAGDGLTLIRGEQNIGFGRGCNLGAQSARGDYLFFLNPDARIDAASIERLAKFLDETHSAAIVGPAIRHADGCYQHAGRMPTPLGIVRAAIGRIAESDAARVVERGAPPFETTWVSGAALMIRRDVFCDLDGFDPRFFLYFEETDLCLRARRAGHEIWAIGEAVVEHDQGESTREQSDRHYSGCIAEHYFQSRFYYLNKHHGRIAAWLTELAELAFLSGRSAVRPGARRVLRARLRGPVLRLPGRVQT